MSFGGTHDPAELTVELRQRDGGLIQGRYYRPDGGELEKLRPAAVDLAKLGSELEFQGKRGLAAATALLDHRSLREREAQIRSNFGQRLGQVLFQLLFPEEALLTRLLQSMFAMGVGDRITPAEKAVRLRIWTDVPLLLELPWRLTRWHGQLLLNCGWRFELASSPRSEGLLEIFSPTRLLIIAPTYPSHGSQPDIGTAGHLECLDEILRTLPRRGQKEAEYLQIVQSRTALLQALRGMQPEILYFYGHGEFLDDQLCLLLDTDAGGEEPLPVADLLNLFGRSPPKIAYLNGCVTAAGGWRSAGIQLGSQVPLVIANRTTVRSRDAAKSGQRFFRHLFHERLDPVEALHSVDEPQSQWDAHWMTTVIHRRYEYSRIAGSPAEYKDPEQHLDLDRDTPRALMVRHVKDLVTDGIRKVEAVVAYAPPGNLLGEFSLQVWRELNHPNEQKLARVQRIPIGQFPALSEEQFPTLSRRLESELRVALGAQRPTETLRQILNRQHRAPPGLVARVLWLDFGVFGRGPGMHPPPTPLREWLTFCKEVLAPNCPDDLHILASLAIEVQEESLLPLVQEQIEEARIDLPSNIFRCSGLHPLTKVTEGDLNEYLKKAKHGPEGLARDLAKLIYRATGGTYEDAVQWLKRGQRDGWSQINQELKTHIHGLPPKKPERKF